ncbi:MAG: hypothetical protein ACUVXJ_06885 [Phycisphaerae bacterium]
MRTAKFLPIVLVSTLMAVAGCQMPPQPVGPTLGVVPAETPEQVDRLWESVETTLLTFNFNVDRRDRLQGIMTTYPETSASGFELWRIQPTPAYYWWESNIHTIQRQADVYIREAPAGGHCELEVKVDRYRLSLEERQVDNAAAAMRLYSREAPTLSGQMLGASQSARRIHLGRDDFLEQAILEAIIRGYKRPTTTTPAGDSGSTIVKGG